MQVYFDRYTRDGPESNETRDTVDFDFQNHIVLGPRHDLIWGFGYRHTQDETIGTIDQSFLPANDSGQFAEAFLQDQITLKPERLAFYIGSKFGNNYFSGFDVEPSLRLAWTPSTRRTFWAAISRAGRTPTRRDVGIDAALAALPGPTEVALLGNPDMQSEHVVAYELGYRAQPTERLSLDLTIFFNNYYGLESIESLPPFVDNSFNPPLTVLPKSLSNKVDGHTVGAEASIKWKLTSHWTLSPGYSFLQMHLYTTPTSLDGISVADTDGSNPRHQAQLRSQVELPKRFAWDTNIYYVGRLQAQAVPSYTRLDTQLSWPLAEHLDFRIIGQNLLHDHHFEFNDFLQSVNSSQVKRSAYAKLTWRF